MATASGQADQSSTIEADLGNRLPVPQQHRYHLTESALPLQTAVHIVDRELNPQLRQDLAQEMFHLVTEMTARPGEQLKTGSHSHSMVPGGLLVMS